MGKFTVHVKSFTCNFTQVKVKKVGMPHRVTFPSKENCEVGIIIAIN